MPTPKGKTVSITTYECKKADVGAYCWAAILKKICPKLASSLVGKKFACSQENIKTHFLSISFTKSPGIMSKHILNEALAPHMTLMQSGPTQVCLSCSISTAKQQSHDKEQMGKEKEKEDTVTEYFLRRYFQQNLDEDFMLDYCLTSNEREIMKLI